MKRTLPSLLLPAVLLALLAGCDLLGIESGGAVAARRDADGRAIGGACRHAGRAIEDCYVLNRKADRAAVFAGWREMNDYMRDNQIEPVTPQLSSPPEASARATPDATASPADKPEAAKLPKQAS